MAISAIDQWPMMFLVKLKYLLIGFNLNGLRMVLNFLTEIIPKDFMQLTSQVLILGILHDAADASSCANEVAWIKAR